MNPDHANPMKLLTCALWITALALPAQVVAVKGGRIVPMSGPEIDNGVVLIENGRITAVGTDVEVPWNAKVVDATGKVVLPTWVLAHQTGGMSQAGENMQNVPYLTVVDAIDPSSGFFEEALRNGVGTIHVMPGHRTLIGGQGMVVKPYGRSVTDMAVVTRSAQKLSLLGSGESRVAAITRLRRAFEEVQEYLKDYERRKQEFEREKAAGAVPADKTWDEELDRKKKPLIDLLQGKDRAHLFVPGPAEAPEALALVARNAFPITLVLGPATHKAAAALAGVAAPVVLDDQLELFETDPDTDVETRICPAAVFHRAGIPFALSINDRGGPGRYPWWQMATLVRHGVDRKTALESMTTVPAKILGLEQDVGSIAPGRIGNLQILSGDPLQATTWVESVLLDGEVVYERSTDPRLQHLFGRTEDAKAAAGGDKKDAR
jgi:imidazolonepropionase-like amidohydrolase